LLGSLEKYPRASASKYDLQEIASVLNKCEYMKVDKPCWDVGRAGLDLETPKNPTISLAGVNVSLSVRPCMPNTSSVKIAMPSQERDLTVVEELVGGVKVGSQGPFTEDQWAIAYLNSLGDAVGVFVHVNGISIGIRLRKKEVLLTANDPHVGLGIWVSDATYKSDSVLIGIGLAAGRTERKVQVSVIELRANRSIGGVPNWKASQKSSQWLYLRQLTQGCCTASPYS
jgi:hypothetical protein